MEKVKDVLFWCMVLGFAVLLIWSGMIVFAGEQIHALHTNLGTVRALSLDLFMSANYIGIGMCKMGVILFFAIPWLAMKIVGNESGAQSRQSLQRQVLATGVGAGDRAVS